MSKIIITGDWHIGSDGSNFEFLKDIAEKHFKGSSILLIGDLIDCGLDRGMNFDNKYNPQTQIDKLKELCLHLYIKGYILGNHELRIFKKTGLNPYKTLFGMEPQHEYNIDGRKIYINHGKSMSQNPFLEHTKYAQWTNADLIALGHSHVLAKLTSLNNGKLRHYVRSGSMLDQPVYATQTGYAPLLKGWIEYETTTNIVTLKAIYEGKVIEI